MNDKMKELLGEKGQTIEKFKKGTFANKKDIQKVINDNIDNITFEVKERRMGVKEEILILKLTVKKE
jgi:hypothetical protein